MKRRVAAAKWRESLQRRRSLAAALCALTLACGTETAAMHELILASTTSTEDSGLFEVLLPEFERVHPEYRVRLVAVGSGEALALGRRRDADVLLVHAPESELEFMRAGFGDTRSTVMSNDFVIAGPREDPAGIRQMSNAADALRRIGRAASPFISRGDNSGTHQKEQQLWAVTGIQPGADAAWHMDVGQGMGDALRVANERDAYILTDRATYLFLSRSLGLDVLVEGAETLKNPYSVITVAQARNGEGARAFAAWIVSAAAQRMIGEYGVAQFGQPLFRPAH